VPAPHVVYQPSLLDAFEATSIDAGFTGIMRHELGRAAWVDHQPGWVTGCDALFDRLLVDIPWQTTTVHMYERKLAQPRLTAHVALDEGAPPELRAIHRALSDRYDCELGACGLNLYRNGRDSVAWHGDRVGRELETALVAIVSLGAPRSFVLRPKGGGPSTKFLLGRGDLIVMGGTTQRTWQHAVPKVAKAGPRISITLRSFEPTRAR